jgi:hypothetical protein
LEDPLGMEQILKTPLAQVSELDMFGYLLPEQPVHRVRQQHLSTVSRRDEPRHPV